MHQFLKSLGISPPFLSCLRRASSSGRGRRHQFQPESQRSKVRHAKRGNQPQIRHLKRKQHQKHFEKKLLAAKNTSFVFLGYGERGRNAFFNVRRIRPRAFFFSPGVEKAEPCLRHVVTKIGICDENVRRRSTSPISRRAIYHTYHRYMYTLRSIVRCPSHDSMLLLDNISGDC